MIFPKEPKEPSPKSMLRYIAFLGAINVGGRSVKMDHLRQLFESFTFSIVETPIPSRNVLVETMGKNAKFSLIKYIVF